MFANPLMLWGLAGASLPLLIHLLNRRKFREEPWAAMRFLLAAMRKNQRRVRLEHWLLLAIRTAILLLVAMAMAKPFLEAFGVIDLLAGQRRHWVLVLDGSMSMDYRVDDKPRFEQAKDVARRLVKDARQGDALSVVLMADPPRAVVGAPAFNKDAVLAEIEALRLPHGGTDLAASFQKIDEVLAQSTLPRKEVVFLTDLQTASWKRPDARGADSLKNAVAKLDARNARSQVIDLGAAGGRNRAVVDVALSPPIVTANNPVVVRATIKNFGREPSGDFTAKLTVGDAVVDERPMRLGPDESETVAFRPSRFPAAGMSSVVVSIPDDALRVDDSRRLVVDVREAVEVLIVDGDRKSEAFRSEADFLAQALSPEPDTAAQAVDGESTSPIHPVVVPEAQFSRTDLSGFDAVVLCNIASFTEAEANALDAYLKQGGGVVVFGGDQVRAESYNRLLFNDGKGLLPASIGPTVGDPAKPELSYTFDPLRYKNPIVAEFDGQPPGVQASLTNVKTFRYHRLKLPKDSTASVALAFDDGDPAVIEAPRHRGRVVQIATSADRDWTSWPLHQSYPPVMEQIVLLAASGRSQERNVRVGQPLAQAFAPSAAGAEATVKRPGNVPPGTTRLKPAGDVSLLDYADTDRSGVYAVSVGPPVAKTFDFAANPDPIESNPAKLDQSGLKEAVRGWNFLYDSDWRGLEKNAGSVGRRGEMHRPMLWAVLILLIVESVLAWRFGHHR